ncbi:MAG: phosphotransferase [Chloroflexota bacterium]
MFEKLLCKFAPNAKLLRTWALKGGNSAQVTALEVMHNDGRRQKMVMRLHGKVDLAHNPNIAAVEFRLLQLLNTAGIATPAPIYLDTACDIFPVPCLVIEFIDGQPEFVPDDVPNHVQKLAVQLANIHQLDCSATDISFMPQQATSVAAKLRQRPAVLNESLHESDIRDALAAIGSLPPRNAPAILHGDYWPGNVLWQHRQLVAVIDWEDAEFGDPLADLANSRLEVLFAFGQAAMQQFTDVYCATSSIDFTHLPYWDLYAALRPCSEIGNWGLDTDAENAMREAHHWFIQQAFAQLPF